MGRRSRKGRPASDAAGAAASGGAGEARAGGDAMRRGYARGRERDEAIRRTLEPLGPGERPAPLVAATAVAALLGALNVAFLLAGVEVRGQDVNAAGVLLLSALLLGAAWGMWTKRYTAVLGFEVLLGVTIAFAALSLLVASNVVAVVLCVAIVGLGGWLFWKLIRVMGRLQAPSRGPRSEVR